MTNATEVVRCPARRGLLTVSRRVLLVVLAAAALLINAIPGDAAFIPLKNGDQVIPPIPLSQVGPNGFVVGDKIFTNFDVFGFGSANVIVPDLSTVFIQGGRDSMTNDWGLHFYIGLIAGQNQFVDANLSFQVNVSPEALRQGFRIHDVGLNVSGPSATASGILSVSETVYDGPSVQTNNLLATLSASFQASGGQLSDHRDFSPQTAIWVRKDLLVSGGTAPNGAAHLSEFFQYYSQVNIFAPEPTSWAMMLAGGGALAMAVVKRRRNQRLETMSFGKGEV